LEFTGTWTQGYGRRWENIHVCTALVFMTRSYTDKTLFFATCDSDEHCNMDATVAVLYLE